MPNLTGKAVPGGPFAIVDANSAAGGFQAVVDNTARDAIPAYERVKGMRVAVENGGVPLVFRYDGVTGVKTDGVAWVDVTAAGSGAPTDATYIVQTANGSLSAEQALSALATGVVKNTTGTGVLSIAAAGTDYLAPAGSGAALTALNATQLTSGTMPDARFPATLPVGSGVNLTALNATNLASGSVPTGRFASQTVPRASLVSTGTANGTTFYRGDGAWSVPGGSLTTARQAWVDKVTGNNGTAAVGTSETPYLTINAAVAAVAAAGGGTVLVVGDRVTPYNEQVTPFASVVIHYLGDATHNYTGTGPAYLEPSATGTVYIYGGHLIRTFSGSSTTGAPHCFFQTTTYGKNFVVHCRSAEMVCDTAHPCNGVPYPETTDPASRWCFIHARKGNVWLFVDGVIRGTNATVMYLISGDSKIFTPLLCESTGARVVPIVLPGDDQEGVTGGITLSRGWVDARILRATDDESRSIWAFGEHTTLIFYVRGTVYSGIDLSALTGDPSVLFFIYAIDKLGTKYDTQIVTPHRSLFLVDAPDNRRNVFLFGHVDLVLTAGEGAAIDSVTASGDLLTAENVPHGLQAWDRVRFTTSNTLPAGLAVETTYIVLADGLTATVFKVSGDMQLAPVITTDAGTGTHAVEHYAPAVFIDSASEGSNFTFGTIQVANDPATPLVLRATKNTTKVQVGTLVSVKRSDGTAPAAELYGIAELQATEALGQIHVTASGAQIRNTNIIQPAQTAEIVAPIATSDTGNPGPITTTDAHGLLTGESVTIAGHTDSDPGIDGVHTITVTGSHAFTIPVNIATGGTGGTATRAAGPAMPVAVTGTAEVIFLNSFANTAKAGTISLATGSEVLTVIASLK